MISEHLTNEAFEAVPWWQIIVLYGVYFYMLIKGVMNARKERMAGVGVCESKAKDIDAGNPFNDYRFG